MDLKLLAAIREYCREHGYLTTEQLLLPKSPEITTCGVSDIFENYFQSNSSTDRLSFTFTVTNKRTELRKRIGTMNDPAVQPNKRQKKN